MCGSCNIGIIFDMDGVLVDSAAPHGRSWQRLAAETGVAITMKQFAATFGQTSRQIIRQFWGADLTDEQVARLDDRKEELHRDLIRGQAPITPGAVDLVRRLASEGVGLVIGSSGPPENIDLVLDEMDVRECFRAVVTGMDVSFGKPDPEVFLTAAAKLGMAPARCVVVEDAPVGIEAAKRAGMAVVALVGTHPHDALTDANLVVDALADLATDTFSALLNRDR